MLWSPDQMKAWTGVPREHLLPSLREYRGAQPHGGAEGGLGHLVAGPIS